MEALKYLETFCEEAEAGQFQPMAEIIDRLGNALIEAACVREGYTELVWRAGVYLLIESGDVDAIYARFGYQAVANALQASLADGTFPLGLGFITHGFLPGGELETLLGHPHIQQALSILHTTKVTISPRHFHETPKAISICRNFLNHAEIFRMPITTYQQIVACMLQATADKQEKEQVIRILLKMLASTEKPLSLFYCWRAACDLYPALWTEAKYMDNLLALLKTCREFPDQGASILAQLHTDEDLLFAIKGHSRLSYVLGLSGWWLSVRHNRKEGENTAWSFVWELIETFPELGKVLKNYLQHDHPPEVSQEEIERLQSDFWKEMRTLRKTLRLRNYRGVPLTLDIQRHNLTTIFEPLCEMLESSSGLPYTIYATVSGLDASVLLDDNPAQKAAARHLKIMGDLRTNMIKDFEEIVASARRALDLRRALLEATPEGAYTPSLTTPEILQEVATLWQASPELRWILEWFLPEIVQALPSEEKIEGSADTRKEEQYEYH